MDTRKQGAAKRLLLSLAAGAALSGCVVAPPYGAYDAYGYGYGYPAYAGPPVSLSFGYSDHRYGGGHGGRGHHGWRGRR